ncbi:MAG: VCBS repeat-containing protein, partial [Bacteroidetes bacterium]|nr:VCBS repeat-containing protein [Bacteroidota bacterium]
STTITSNTVYFGAARGKVTAATATSLTVTVPTGATYQPITVASAGLAATSSRFFMPVFGSNRGFYGGTGSTGSFGSPVSFPGPSATHILETGVKDMNGDGVSEIFYASSPQNNALIYLNYSQPTYWGFMTGAQITGSSTDVTGIAAADFNGDSLPDAVVIYPSGTISCYKNTTSGFTSSLLMYPAGSAYGPASPLSTTTADIDGDGKTDLLVMASTGSYPLRVMPNSSTTGGSISFNAGSSYSLPGKPAGLTVGDIDGDGKTDIIAVSGSSLSIFRNKSGAGNFLLDTRMDIPLAQKGYGVAVGDYDGDGKNDIAVTNFDTASNINLLSVFRNTSTPGTLSFATSIDIPTGTWPVSCATGDLNGDGKPDIAVSNSGPDAYNNRTFSVFGNNCSPGTIGFSPPISYTAPYHATGRILVADVNNDGRPDVLLTITFAGQDRIYIYRNRVNEPSYTSVSPERGGAGSVIVIKGIGFTSTSSVTFGGKQAASFTVVSDSVLTAIPAEGGSGSLVITTAEGLTSRGGFVYVPTKLSGFTPAEAKTGQQVTIQGNSLAAVSSVSFGGTPAASFSIQSDSVIIATVGEGATGNIKIVTPYTADSIAGFSYIKPIPRLTAFSPTAAGTGETVTISGANLSGITGVSFGSQPAASFAIVSDSVIKAVVGTGASGQLFIGFAGGSDSLSGFSYIPPASGDLIVYPNPATKGYTNIRFPESADNAEVSVYYFSGSLARHFTVAAHTRVLKINLTGLPPGMYKISWTDGHHTYSKTILIR